MADPQVSFRFVLGHECRKNPDGSFNGETITDIDGGSSRFGIDSVSHPEALTAGFYQMSDADALVYAGDIFKYDYFNMILGYAIIDQQIAAKYSDLAFNTGVHEATLIVQRAVNSLRSRDTQVAIDGKPGALTTAAINALDASPLLQAISKYGIEFYSGLRDKNPAKYTDKIYNVLVSRVQEVPPA